MYDVESKLSRRIRRASDYVTEEFEAARIIELLFAYNIGEKGFLSKKNNIRGMHGEEAFQYFDFHGRFYQKRQQEELEEILKDEDFSKKYLAIAGSKSRLEGDKIEINHAYSIEPITIDNERKILVRNPHNTSRNIILSFDEYFENFIETFIANIDTRHKNIF